MNILHRILRRPDEAAEDTVEKKLAALVREKERVERIVEAYEQRVEVIRGLGEQRDQQYDTPH
jgi:hypothetical protein